MKKLSYIYILLFAALAVSCSEEELETFDGRVSGIYMQMVSGTTYNGQTSAFLYNSYSDSIYVSFSTEKDDVKSKTVSLNLGTMGNVVDYDRSFTLKVDESKSTAVKGIHYDYDESMAFIPANSAKKSIPITLYRHEDLKKKDYRIEFFVESNENFTTELESYKNRSDWTAATSDLCGTRFKIILSEQYTEPNYWGWFCEDDYFGKWTVSKFLKLNSVMGWSVNDWQTAGSSGARISLGRFPYAAKKMRKALQEEADSGHPVLDDDGEYMQLLSPYLVDYSAYD